MVDMLYMHISTWRTQVQILVLTNFNKHDMGRTTTQQKKSKISLWAGFRLTGSNCPIRSGYDNYNKPQFRMFFLMYIVNMASTLLGSLQ